MDLGLVSAGLGVGLIVLGVAMGMGKIGKAAMEAIGRQPEAAAKIQTAMIVISALLEGVALFAVIVCLLIVNK
ncbi:MAG: ATP synthase F0 subunit C [Cytophagales bacterium]|jgi:F-type H+-transporting ATPase subunit c|nr:ATP synthase F0 subunit C [Cytophagales bacterium]